MRNYIFYACIPKRLLLVEVHVVEGGVNNHDFKDPIQYMNIIFIHILVIVIVTSEGYSYNVSIVMTSYSARNPLNDTLYV